MFRLSLSFCLLLVSTAKFFAQDDDVRGIDGLTEVPFAQLSDTNLTALGKAALSVRPGDWKHAETKNFIYHFFHGFIATPVSVEAEFYYRVVSKELERDTSQWERKCHIFIFEKPDDWRAFQGRARLDPWTGGIQSGGSLFIQRILETKFKGRSLGHETTHLVVNRFMGSEVPLWLNEGYAEYASIRAYASYLRARNYAAKPQTEPFPATDFMPLRTLTEMVTYPEDVREVNTFYIESEKLVRFLAATNKQQFLAFFEAQAKGAKFESALWKTFGSRFPSLEALESEFKNYVAKENAATLSQN